MKKYFYSLLAATTMLFTASCSQDEELVAGGSENQTVTFEVALPGATQTRAIAEGVEVGKGNIADNLIYALYEKLPDGTLKQGSSIASGALTQGVATDSRADGHFEVKLDMVKGLTYEILFLAYNPANCIFNISDPLTQDLRQLTLKNTLNANQESYDAFVASVQHSVNNEAVTYIELTRPFAQVNAATTVEDLDKTKTLEAVVTKSQLTINSVPTKYNVFTAEATEPMNLTYQSADILKNINAAQGAHTNEVIEVEGKNYYYLTLAYVLAGKTADADKSLHNAKFEFFRDADPKLVQTIDIANLPIQRNYRTNVIGNLLTQSEGFEVVIDAKFNDGDHNVTEIVVANDVDLEKALRTDEENIIINLSNDMETRAAGVAKTYNVNISSWVEQYYFGGASTKTITINGNGNTINFVQHDGDWNYVRCVNEECKWFLNDLNLTNSGKNTGHWKRNLIRFYNEVELNNVKSEKGICLMNDATLNGLDINVADENYALWITAQGQTVNVDGLNVTATNKGRGIKIGDEDYESVAEKVTLNVKNAKFNTAKKAAVLVSSVAGADINWGEGNDISGVAADIVNAVWVDEDWNNIEDVTVTGCTVIVEGEVAAVVTVTNADELKAAIAAAGKDAQTIINLKAGTYAGAFDIDGKNVLLMSTENAVVDGLVHALNWAHVTLRGLTLTNATPAKSASARHTADYYCLGSYVADWVIEDCTFNVNNSGNAAGKGAINIYANRSDWETSMIDGVQYDLVIKNCTFNCNGERPIRGKTNSWVEGCTFNDQHRYAIQVQGNSGLATETVTFINNKIVNPAVTSGEPFAAGVSISKSQLIEDATFNISGNTMESDKFSVLWYVYDDNANVKYETFTVNGATFYPDSKVENVVATQEAFTAALSGGKTEIVLEAGKTFNLGGATIAASEVTITGLNKETSVINMNKSINQSGKTLNLNNLTYTTPKGLNYSEHDFAFIHYINFNMDNCIVKEGLRLNVPSGNITNCDFIHTTSSGFDGYPLYYYGADNSTLNVKECTFNTVSKGIVIYSEGAKTYNLNVEKCTFTASKTDDKAAIQMHTELGITGNVRITECSATGFADPYGNGGLWNELNNTNGTPTDKFDIWVDGTQVH